MVEDKIREVLTQALKELGYETGSVHLEHPADLSHGDYSTNAALILGKQLGKNPKELAKQIAQHITENKSKKIEKVEVAGAGFINFHLSRSFFTESIQEILNQDKKWGSNKTLKGKKVMVEYTDPNPFKEFHIGHLMSNAIGESISRLIEFSGAEVRRANYQGDIGLHVAKAIWGRMRNPNHLTWGASYSFGAKAYEDDESARREIDEINKKLYLGTDKNLNEVYRQGLEETLEAFEKIYQMLGMETRDHLGEQKCFDFYFFESISWNIGKVIVEQNIPDVFEESEGAIIFRGEKFNKKLHTRVFINSEGLPTYETKELGLLKSKLEKYNFDTSITITANEQKEYFKVVLKSAEQIDELMELAKKTVHITHGMMRLPSGKMSSRTGDVIDAKRLILGVGMKVRAIINDRDINEKDEVAQQIAMGALKYWILKQSAGKDIIFDEERALSFEGDSGPYLQYSNTRALSVLKKAADEDFKPGATKPMVTVPELERLLYRFPDVVVRATKEYEPHYITTYLTQLAGVFNSWYAKERIIDDSAEAPYRLALTKAFQITMENGLWLLGIKAPRRM